MNPLDRIDVATRPLRDRLMRHPIAGAVDSAATLATFMEHHAFAVWDFMTLLKALQRHLTCTDVPWVPRGEGTARHLINAIVLEEESDDDGRGGHASHFELYLDAMRQAGADVGPIGAFVAAIRRGTAIAAALELADAPAPARAFVGSTWNIVESGSPAAIAAAFTLGREDLIPDLFRGLVARLAGAEPGRFDLFRRYLDRHVELDGDEHGPMARRMLADLCGDDPGRWRDAHAAAVDSYEARLRLWDGVLARIKAPAVR